MYIIQQKTQYQWEPIQNGEFGSETDAFDAMAALVSDLGCSGLRVVEDTDEESSPT